MAIRSRPQPDASQIQSDQRRPERPFVRADKDEERRHEGKVTSFDATNLLKGVSAFVGPATFAAALAFYFGWERTYTLLEAFGVDPSLVSYSAQDYILRGVDGIFTPLVLVSIAGLFGLGIHTLLAPHLASHPNLTRWLARISVAIGFLLLAGVVLALVDVPLIGRYDLGSPIMLGTGVVCVSYGLYLSQSTGSAGLPSWVSYGLVLSAITLVGLSLFWATSVYAQAVGRTRAQDIADGLSAQPDAVVFSHDRLGIDSSDVVTETAVGDEHSAYRYKYDGLRLLLKSGGKFFLLPADWEQHRGTVVILSDTDAIRIAFVKAGA
jgi:hypothetical protein